MEFPRRASQVTKVKQHPFGRNGWENAITFNGVVTNTLLQMEKSGPYERLQCACLFLNKPAELIKKRKM
jgi:hypothetical protein